MKNKILLPLIFVAVFAVSRIPGLMPQNFSVVYAFVFCAGIFFPRNLVWWLPLAAVFLSDILINVFGYHAAAVGFYMIPNYAVYALLILLGKQFGKNSSFPTLIFGGLLGALIFYFVTNTFAWLADSAYAKTLAGWIQALTTGRPDFHPTTWEMFRNTLLSGGIFTALFAAAAKFTAESPADKTAGQRAPEKENEAEPQAEPEEASA